jgi:transcriptional regulator with XRE-family HTH domain
MSKDYIITQEEQGARIRELLEAKGITNTELARRTGVKRAQVWRWLEGKQSAANKLPAIAKALGVEIVDLWVRPGSAIPRTNDPKTENEPEPKPPP